jgi:hypothetical protein
MEKDDIIRILRDFQSGKLDKYEAMEALDLYQVRDLQALLSQYEIPPDDSPAYWQSDPSAKPLKDFFTDDGTR